MQIKKKWGLVAAAALTAGALALGASPAMADPSGTPSDRPLKGVGSDTTQYLYNGLSQQLKDGSNQKYVSSFDATGTPANITTWSGGHTFKRPDGSTAGANALRAAATGGTYDNGSGGTVTLDRNDVNFARSSSVQTWGTGTTLSYITAGTDVFTWATKTGSILPTTIPVGNTTDASTAFTLRNIYAGNVTTYTSGGTTITLHPLLPQAGSGSRKFFTDVVLKGTTINTSVVQDKVGGVDVQENSDASLLDGSYIMPYSVGSFVAQGNASTLNSNYGTAVVNKSANARLGQVDANAPVSGGIANSSFPIKRPVFTVVATDSITSGNANYNATLVSTFLGTSASAYTANSPYSGNKIIEDFGFLRGTTTVNGLTYTVGTATATSGGTTTNLTTN